MDHWVDLPQDVFLIILKEIDMPIDILNVSSVCKPWHSVSMEYIYHHYTNVPIFHFLPKRKDPEMQDLYSINEKRTYNRLHMPGLRNKWIIGSTRDWVLTLDNKDKHIVMVNPFKRRQILLPHLSTFPKPLNPVYYPESGQCWHVKKLNAFFGPSGKLKDCAIVAIVSSLSRICFCRIGDDKWTNIYKSPTMVTDAIRYNGVLCFVNHQGVLFAIDINSHTECSVIAGPDRLPLSTRYLVESPCGLLLVVRNVKQHDGNDRTIGFQVFRLIKNESKYKVTYGTEDGRWNKKRNIMYRWTEVEGFGNWSLFLGYNYSLCLDSRLHPASKKNCIYFADHQDEEDVDRFFFVRPNTPHDIGVYDLQEKTVECLT